jgi:histidine ammonia-lyase
MVEIGATPIRLNDFEDIVYSNVPVKLSKEVKENVKNTHTFLTTFIKGKVIYGINTGLGPMAQYRIESADQIQLQKNLIRSHSAGLGAHQPAHHVKGAMLARLVTFAKAKSGVSLETLETLIAFINNNIIPVVSTHGGVGASGDLVQLSQIALCLIGEGEVYFEGKIRSTVDVLKELQIKPLNIGLREGLALINGTSFMTSIACTNLIYAKRALNQAILNGCLLNELVESFDDHYSIELNSAKQHKHQRIIAEKISDILKDSKLTKSRAETYYQDSSNDKVFAKKVQEYYSLRCLPQVLGPIDKVITDAEEVVIDELNSVSDNPIIDMKSKNIYHGGNFHGDFISAEMNKLKNGIIKLSVLSERQLNFLLNQRLNNIFPPFLNAGTLGLNLGLQGVQYTATSTTAENQSLSASIYVHSIPSNNDNQDLVSMGTNEALLTRKVIDNFYDVNSVLTLAIFQANSIKNEEIKLSLRTGSLIKQLREIVPVIRQDVEIRPILEDIKEFLSSSLEDR